MAGDVLSPAILQYIDRNAYPDSEDVISANLDSTALSNILTALRKEQDDVKAEIRSLSKGTAPDIDTWISRAKDLQNDILRSRETARQIVAEAEQGRELRSKTEDAGKKVGLLEKEVGFNEALTGTLEHVKYAGGVLDQAREELLKGKVERALERLEDAEASVSGLQGFEGSKAVGLLVKRVEGVRTDVEESTVGLWNQLVLVEQAGRQITVKQQDGERAEDSLEGVVKAATGLDILPRLLQKLTKDTERTLLRPLMSVDRHGMPGSISVTDDSIRCGRHSSDDHSETLFADLEALVDFFATRLPGDMGVQLSQNLVPSLISRLEEYWLEPSIPLEMSHMSAFEGTLSHVNGLAQHLETRGWHGAAELRGWVENAPRAWLTKRRETVLGDVRNLVFTGLRETKTVERVETQMVSKGDELASGGEATDDDWDTAWDEPEEEQPNVAEPEKSKVIATTDDDDDTSAWDTDDLDEDAKKSYGGGEEAWGWGDEESSQKPGSPVAAKKEPFKPNGDGQHGKSTEREMTLRETYTVTAIPESIMSTIQAIIADAQTLAGPDFASTPVAPAAAGLYSLPTLALAIYRATAPTAYTKLDTGNMLIYNDASRLSEQLRAWQASQPPASRLRLDNDAKALDQFAKRAYSAEMESQRTILRDLLDGAQGFSNCTVSPYKAECESAIEQTVDRLREVHRQWSPILAQSALLQSLGSLLSTATSKIITDVEDLGDISEPDSKQLKSLMDQVAAVKDLFAQQDPKSGNVSDMTFIYCPNWLKFQYLAEILESSLADIKYLWNEGELSLEFSGEEVIELIEALFADSDLRRRACAEIRRSGRG